MDLDRNGMEFRQEWNGSRQEWNGSRQEWNGSRQEWNPGRQSVDFMQHMVPVTFIMKYSAKTTHITISDAGVFFFYEYSALILRGGLNHRCIADCDMCGLGKVFHGKDPENAYDDYIKGIRTFADVSDDYKH